MQAFLAAKIEPSVLDLHFSDLRHVALTRMAIKGVPQAVIARVAGHQSTKTTDIYLNFRDEQLTQAAIALEAYRRPTEKPEDVLPDFCQTSEMPSHSSSNTGSFSALQRPASNEKPNKNEALPISQ